MHMKLAITFPVLPPVLDGIGDYTARIAEELAKRHEVQVLTAQADFAPIPGVTVRHTNTESQPFVSGGLSSLVKDEVPDWLVVQYNPFSWGRYGFNLGLPEVLRKLKRTYHGLRVAVMVHEPYVPINSWQFAVMTVWQRWQLWRLGHVADLMFGSIEEYVRRVKKLVPRTPTHHLPVGSNIPRFENAKNEARDTLGLQDPVFLVGLFGSGFVNGMLPYVRAAMEALSTRSKSVCLIYIGTKGDLVRAALDGVPLHDMGPLSYTDVSRCFAAMDMYLAPFVDGVSTRRGSFMVGLEHAVPSVTTMGKNTDAVLREHDGRAFRLATSVSNFAYHAVRVMEDPGAGAAMGQRGRDLYCSEFGWDVISQRMVSFMKAIDRDRLTEASPLSRVNPFGN